LLVLYFIIFLFVYFFICFIFYYFFVCLFFYLFVFLFVCFTFARFLSDPPNLAGGLAFQQADEVVLFAKPALANAAVPGYRPRGVVIRWAEVADRRADLVEVAHEFLLVGGLVGLVHVTEQEPFIWYSQY
jgi:energy-coupling factor transporter transmembrane protein EcfT